MSDTARARATFLSTIFRTNTAKEIGAQDLRDFVVTSMGVFGCIHGDVDAPQQDNIDTNYTKLTGWAGVNGLSEGVTPDQANDKLIATLPGVYDVTGHMSFAGTTNTVFTFHVFVDGVDSGQGGHRKIGASSDEGSCAIDAVVLCPVGTEEIDIRVKANAAGKSVIIHETSIIKVKLWA